MSIVRIAVDMSILVVVPVANMILQHHIQASFVAAVQTVLVVRSFVRAAAFSSLRIIWLR